MADQRHSREQGQRVHHLANVGGLAAIARIDGETPDFLMGVFLQVGSRISELTPGQREVIEREGHAKLKERAAEKRAWSSWQRNNDLRTVVLSTGQLREIISALRENPPQNSAALLSVLNLALGEVR